MVPYSDVVIPLTVFMLFAIFITGMILVMSKSNFSLTSQPWNFLPTKNQQNKLQQNGDGYYIACNAGECVTDIQTGQKTCPNSPDVILHANAKIEVCNPPFSCTNPLTPYALQSDESTDPFGVCEEGIQCPCFSKPQCQNYILSTFTTTNINAYNPLSFQRSFVPQNSSGIKNGQTSLNPPIAYDNIEGFCTAPVDWLKFTTPGCGFVGLNEFTPEDLELCMGQARGCSGLNGSACESGVLSILANDSSKVTKENLNTYQIACTVGIPCPCGKVSIYDTSFGGIVCRTLE